jgi:hypothetical protein
MTADKGPGAQGGPGSEAAPLRSAQWTQHAGLIVSTLSLFVISTQLLAMAGFDPTTASFILAERGAGNVGIALLMNLIPGSIPMAAAYMTAFLVRNRGRRPLGYSTVLINSFLWWLSLYVAPWWITVAAVFLAVLSMTKKTQEGDGNPSRFDRVVLLMSASFVGLVLAAIVTSSANILPTENLTPSGEKAFAGIVLGEDDPGLVVLRFEDRQVVRIAAKGTTRVPCRSVTPLGLPGGGRSIMSFRDREPRYPGCLRSSR